MSEELLSPWDALPWFDTPQGQSIAVAAVRQTVIGADPRRTVLIFACTDAANTVIVGLTNSTGGFAGIPLNRSNPPLILTQREHGPLCQQSWDAVATPGASGLLVLPVTLRDWPKE